MTRSNMPTILRFLSRRLQDAGAGIFLLAAASCAQLPPAASGAGPPIPAGEARVWIYRVAGPYDSQARPYIRVNSGVVAISEPRGAFYRDLPPGHYHFSVDSYLTDVNQTKDVDLTPGQQVYFKIVAAEFACSGGGSGGSDGGGGGSTCQRDNFYVWSIPPEVAQGELARSPFLGGG
jgi:hypothetical protein